MNPGWSFWDAIHNISNGKFSKAEYELNQARKEKMSNPKIDQVDGRITIEHDGLRIIVGNDHVSIDTDRKVSLKGKTLKRLAGVQSSALNLVLHKLEE